MSRRDHALELLHRHPELAELAAFPFDFDIRRADHVEGVRLASGAELRPLAGDDTGGTYFLCPGGEVLYADSEGSAGLIGDSLDEALEMLFGLAGWQDLVCRSALVDCADGTGEPAAAVARAQEDVRDAYGPEVDDDRRTILAGLGLRLLPPLELLRRMQQSLLRTEPDFLLLNDEEGCAYALLDGLPRPPAWEPLLAPARAELAELRAEGPDGPGRSAAAADPARRAVLLRAAQFDRHDADLPLLRALLRAEAALGDTEDLRLAAVLVALHGQAEDFELLRSLREDDPDVRLALDGFPGAVADLGAWAAELDDSRYGTDPADQDELLWAGLARRLGRTEEARCLLVRRLDDTGPRDALLLGRLAGELAALGDLAQAARAQHLHASLQDDPQDRGSALLGLASLQRQGGRADAAWQSLQRAVAALDAAPQPPAAPADAQLALELGLAHQPPRVLDWRGLGLGVLVVEEHFLLAREAGTRSRAGRAAAAAGAALLETLPRRSEGLRGLADRVRSELS